MLNWFLKFLAGFFLLSSAFYELLQGRKPFKRADTLSFLKRRKKSAKRAHGRVVLRHYIFRVIEFKDFLECLPDACVCRNPSLERNRPFKILALSDCRFEIPRNGIAKPRHDIIMRGCNLLKVYHVAFCEHAAAARHPGRVFAFKGKLRELLYRKVHAGGLLVKKTPCARGTHRIHLKILNPEFLCLVFFRGQKNKLRVLPSHLNYGSHLGMEKLGCLCLGYDLVCKLGAYIGGDELPAASCRGNKFYGVRPVTPRNLLQHDKGCIKRVALCPYIVLFQHVFILVEHNGLAAYRAYVNT